MGVHGLTNYIKKSPNLPSTTVELTRANRSVKPIPFVIDGPAFLHHTVVREPNDHTGCAEIVELHIQYWRAVGLEPVFVFNGPSDMTKLHTRISRDQQRLNNDIKYFQSSDKERAMRSSHRQISRLSPLAQSACVDKLRALKIKIHFAQGDADSSTAEMAQRLGAFVASDDSDYFIFPSSKRGYTPFYEMKYGPRGWNFPTADLSNATLRMRAYRSDDLAQFLGLPSSFLPVFAAFLGNDLVKGCVKNPGKPGWTAQFPGQVTPALVRRIAGTLRKLRAIPADTKDETEAVIRMAIPLLLSKTSVETTMVTRLVDAAESYRLVPVEIIVPSFPLHPKSSDDSLRSQSRKLYFSAFKQGRVGLIILHFLKNGIFTTKRGILEDPSEESTVKTLGGPMRRWIYAIMEYEIGTGHEQVKEYVRVGRRIRNFHVAVAKIDALIKGCETGDLLPVPTSIIQAPVKYRLQLLYAAMSSSSYIHSDEHDPFLPLLLALRHIQRTLKRPWPTHDIRAAILAAVDLPSLSGAFYLSPPELTSWQDLDYAPAKSAIQRSAELLQTLLHLEVLVETLLLTEVVQPSYRVFGGVEFHRLMRMGKDGLLRSLDGRGEVAEKVEQLVKLVERKT